MSTSGIPMFPLPGFFIFPGAVAPLHIFEPRYRQMMDDLLDRAGRLVMATITRQNVKDIRGNPPVMPIGCLVEIAHHKKLEDGRYLIWIVGLSRVRIRELSSDRMYRLVDVELLEDEEGSDAETSDLRPLLMDAIAARARQAVELTEEMPIGTLADILLQCLQLSPQELAEIYIELNPSRRARQALTWHQTSD